LDINFIKIENLNGYIGLHFLKWIVKIPSLSNLTLGQILS
jgi:hypothetical protein